MTTVQVSHVSKSFGNVKAVQDVSFEVYPGEVFGLLGPNGAGKTTTIRMILDIFRPDGGEVTIFDGKLTEEKKNRIGYMPEERGLYKDLKLEPTLIFLATLKGLDEATARARLGSWLERFDLQDYRQQKVQNLSKGMQQKAQLIATLLHDPDLLVVDEPFAGLDPLNTRLVKDIIEELRQQGKTVIMSAHQMHQVEALCNRIVLIDHGRNVLYGEVDKIKRDFAGNALTIEGQGDFTNLPGVLEARHHNGTWSLTLGTGVDSQDVLRAIMRRDGVKLERFEIAEPSLEDIFVTVVQRAEQEEATYA
ncbi:MAG TPA: ATP-binding cassette domain-containing protein [Anaerolineae bacterium]|nr:ATP-binding cassette domain-containing protein [Anaerolineae bacterium]HQH37876.1 ATP-binding cassette domain-containing protein [Anaerolineae bacterium]